jgi:hypothetical protein
MGSSDEFATRKLQFRILSNQFTSSALQGGELINDAGFIKTNIFLVSKTNIFLRPKGRS